MADRDRGIDTQAGFAVVSISERQPAEIRRAVHDPSITDVGPLFVVTFDGAAADVHAAVEFLWGAPLRRRPQLPQAPEHWAAYFQRLHGLALRVWDGATCTLLSAGKPGWWQVALISPESVALMDGPQGLLAVSGLQADAAALARRTGWETLAEESVSFSVDDEVREYLDLTFRHSGWIFLMPQEDGRGPGVLALNRLHIIRSTG